MLHRLAHDLSAPQPPQPWRACTLRPGGTNSGTTERNRHTLVDMLGAQLLQRDNAGARAFATTVNQLDVCRQGSWTCPVRTGAVCLALLQHITCAPLAHTPRLNKTAALSANGSLFA